MQKKILAICIDRDNDLGEKTKVSGPIIGEKDNLCLAQQMGIADPEDSDMNAMYAAIKLAKEIDGIPVTITGDKSVGVKSDAEIIRQIEKVKKITKTDDVVLISDGAEDERILPILQPHINLISIKKVSVKQSNEMQGAYFAFTDFAKKLMKDRKIAISFLGVPGIILLLNALFPEVGIRIILAVLGIFFILKGFQLETPLYENLVEFKNNLFKGKFSFFTVLISGFIATFALINGLDSIQIEGDKFVQILLFINSSVYLFLLAGILFVSGKLTDLYSVDRHRFYEYLSVPLSFVVVCILLGSTTGYLLDTKVGYTGILLSFLVSLIIIAAFFLIKRR